jgi:hypothetical protein
MLCPIDSQADPLTNEIPWEVEPANGAVQQNDNSSFRLSSLVAQSFDTRPVWPVAVPTSIKIPQRGAVIFLFLLTKVGLLGSTMRRYERSVLEFIFQRCMSLWLFLWSNGLEGRFRDVAWIISG